MTILEQVNASAPRGKIIIRTLEITCAAWDAPVLICNGFEDQVCVTEDARTLTFLGANIDIQLAKKNNKGNQTLAFAIDNTTGEAQRKIDQGINANQRISAVYRTYIAGMQDAPAEPPYFLTVGGGTLQGNVAQLQCGYFDLIGVAWPRKLYTVTFAPALRYAL